MKKLLILLLISAHCFAIPKYSRNEFGGGWIDADHDCQNTRDEVLIAESVTPVVLDEKKCSVVSGLWLDPYTGLRYTDPILLDIDHVVPLNEAWRSGAYAWDKQKRIEYANDLEDPGHLIAVYRGANRMKSDQSPEFWMPSNISYWEEYLTDWEQIKHKWKLDDSKEQKIIPLLRVYYTDNNKGIMIDGSIKSILDLNTKK